MPWRRLLVPDHAAPESTLALTKAASLGCERVRPLAWCSRPRDSTASLEGALMFSWLANAWRVPELRKRVLFTFMILALYRLGSWIPAPGVDSQTIKDYFNGRGGTILGLLNVFSGGALSQFALFALGIMPYVTASIILQLMTVVVPQLEQLQKEGESGYAKINQYTRYLTVVLAAAQATGYAYLFHKQGALSGNPGRLVLIIVTLTAGTTLLMWIRTRRPGLP